MVPDDDSGMTESSWPSRELVESNVDQEFLAFLRPVGRPLLAFTSGHFPPGTVSIPHSHPCLVMHGCLSGPITIVTPEFRQTIEAGQLYLFPAGQLHHWESVTDRTAATIGLLVDAERPGDWPEDSGVVECCRQLLSLVDQPKLLTTAGDPELRSVFWRAADVLTDERPYRQIAVNSILWQLLALLLERLDDSTGDQVSNEAAKRIRRVLLNHVYDTPTLHQIAREAHLSLTRAKEVFSATYGCGIKEYLSQLKLYQAQRMLGDSNMSVQEISRRLGFSSPAYFSRLFRVRTGESPQQFRRRLR
jgi:AraC-like DNA-binding protein/quercetin dioxygenase-like cupin family protein